MKPNMKIFDIYSSKDEYQTIFIMRVSDSEWLSYSHKFLES